MNTFELLEQEKINKESIEIIFEQIMSKKANNVLQALKNASIIQLSENELDKVLDEIIQRNMEKIQQEHMHALKRFNGHSHERSQRKSIR